MKDVIVWVLISITTASPYHNGGGRLIKEYQSTFARQDTCVAIMDEMNRSSSDHTWYCEKHLVE